MELSLNTEEMTIVVDALRVAANESELESSPELDTLLAKLLGVSDIQDTVIRFIRETAKEHS